LMLQFQDRFDILFRDPEFGFTADDDLIAQVIASLSYEHVDYSTPIMRLDEITDCIYFVYEGEVTVSYKQTKQPLLLFEQGSYIGETSFILKIRNQYTYQLKLGKEPAKIYGLQQKYLDPILREYPEWKNVLKVRALRRHHYLRKMKNQN